MQPQWITLPSQILAGISFFGDPFRVNATWTEDNEIGRLWQRFINMMQAPIAGLPVPKEEGILYEIHIYHPETLERGEYEVFVGMEIETAHPVPPVLSLKVFPPRMYAVFTLCGQEIVSDWYAQMTAEIEAAGYVQDGEYSVQRYDSRFKGMDRLEESELDIYIPVRRVE